jgi:hypothetical protein
MSAPRYDNKTPIQLRAPAAKIALTGIVPLLALIALGPLTAGPTFLQFLAPSTASSTQDPVWAGHLDHPQLAPTATEPFTTVNSTSYTSGFDPAAVGLLPPKAALAPGRNAQIRACAEDGADKAADPLRTASACSKSTKTAALPLPRPAEFKPVVAPADKPAPKSNDVFGFISRLPSTSQLFSPFTYVGDKVSGLFKKPPAPGSETY